MLESMMDPTCPWLSLLAIVLIGAAAVAVALLVCIGFINICKNVIRDGVAGALEDHKRKA